MDYIRWLIFVKFNDFFETGVFIPVFFLNCFLAILFIAVSMAFGILFVLLTGSLWLLIIFVFLQREWNKNREEYRKFMKENS